MSILVSTVMPTVSGLGVLVTDDGNALYDWLVENRQRRVTE